MRTPLEATDLGTHLSNTDIRSQNVIWLFNLSIQNVEVLDRDSFGSVIEHHWERRLFVGALQFGVDVFRGLMLLQELSARDKLKANMIGRTCPFTLQLPASLTLRSVECILGNVVQTQTLSFTPLIVRSFAPTV